MKSACSLLYKLSQLSTNNNLLHQFGGKSGRDLKVRSHFINVREQKESHVSHVRLFDHHQHNLTSKFLSPTLWAINCICAVLLLSTSAADDGVWERLMIHRHLTGAAWWMRVCRTSYTLYSLSLEKQTLVYGVSPIPQGFWSFMAIWQETEDW